MQRLETKEGLKEIVVRGAVVHTYEKRLIERLTEHPTLVEFEGIRTHAVNSGILNSEIANVLLKKFPPIAIVWREREGNVGVSVRSDGSVDVSKLAAKYGGGGHERSSGFLLRGGKKIPWRSVKD